MADSSSTRARLRDSLADAGAEEPLVGARVAAIALVLIEQALGLEMLLIERATREGDPWSGHMALPGGHVEPSDLDLAATAERETLEEVGLDLRQAGERLGRLSDYTPYSQARGLDVAVRPFVYLLRELPALTLSAEVRRALWVPVAPLLRGEQRTTYVLTRASQRFEFPAWEVDGGVVWGLTYRVLDEFFRRFSAVSGSL